MKEESLDLIYEEEQYTDDDIEFELALIARALYRMTEKTHRSFNVDTLYSEPEGRVSVRVDIFIDRKELLNAGCDSHESWNHISRYARPDRKSVV